MKNNALAIPCVAVLLSLVSVQTSARAGETPAAKQLTNTQLDTITAGTFAIADGDAAAQGDSAKTQVSITALASPAVQSAATGQVSASAASSGSVTATASATLSLAVVIP